MPHHPENLAVVAHAWSQLHERIEPASGVLEGNPPGPEPHWLIPVAGWEAVPRVPGSPWAEASRARWEPRVGLLKRDEHVSQAEI